MKRFDQEKMNKLYDLCRDPVISKMTNNTGCVYIFGACITDVLYNLPTPYVKVFSFEPYEKTVNGLKGESQYQRDILGMKKENPNCWRFISKNRTIFLYTVQSAKNCYDIDVKEAKDILDICKLNYEKIFMTTSMRDIRCTNEYSTFLATELISFDKNTKLDVQMVNDVIKAEKRYKLNFSRELQKEVSSFLRNAHNAKISMKKDVDKLFKNI